jgi:hypothetical protein
MIPYALNAQIYEGSLLFTILERSVDIRFQAVAQDYIKLHIRP